MYQYFIKRVLDLLLAVAAILLLAFPMLVVAVVIKIDSPGPVLFRQQRIGLHQKPFTILKFRSMPTSVPADLPTDRFRSAEPLTKWQRFIRRSSIDELPQLFNILVGHMSVVGPRPALGNQEELLAERDRYGANDVKPGLTGPAQINGRDQLTDRQKAVLDGEYAQRLNAGRCRGFAMDARCFFATFGAVLRSDGVVEGGADNRPDSENGGLHE